nr:Fic family protein [Planctomycetota bacterium]
MHSLSHDFLDACSFHSEQLAVLTALGHARGRQDLFSKQTPETLEALRQVAAVESSESSNRIEGIEAPRKRIEALVLRRTEPRDRSEQEIAGYRDALALIHESHPHMPLSAGVLLQLHQTLYRYHPAEGGRWKAADNEIVERNPDGSIARVRFRTVSVVETPGAIESLVARANEAFSQQQREALLLIPLVALDLLCIHPFRDGNGRVARLVTLLLLYRAGFEVGRYISLERIIEQSKQSYYETLEESSRGWHEGSHDPHPWLEYFW